MLPRATSASESRAPSMWCEFGLYVERRIQGSVEYQVLSSRLSHAYRDRSSPLGGVYASEHKLKPHRLFRLFVVVVMLAGRLVQDPLETRGHGLSSGCGGIWKGVPQTRGNSLLGCTEGRAMDASCMRTDS